ncbi:MAG: hypothetical protein ACFUZC_14890 [Chthoniobacteraceae bacterium]
MDNILSNTKIEPLTRTAKAWLTHAACCLSLYAEIRKVDIHVKSVLCRAGALRIEALVPNAPEMDRDAIARIIATAEAGSRVSRGTSLSAITQAIEILRGYPCFLGAYIDPRVTPAAFRGLKNCAKRITIYDPHAGHIRILAVRATLAGRGPVRLEVTTRGGTRAWLQFVECAEAGDFEMRADGLPGVRYRKVDDV